MNANRLYPGMCDGSLEFFYHEEKQAMMAITNGETKPFIELEKSELSVFANIIDTDSALKSILQEWFPNNRILQKQELAKCRFGGLNLIPDFSPCRTQINHDYINCRIRGKCAGEGIVCKPISYNGYDLTHTEIQAIKLLSTDLKNYEIALKLEMAFGTFNVFRSNLYEKLNIHNKQDLTRIGVKLGIC